MSAANTNPVEIVAPCGQTFDSVADMGSHAALCDQCAGAAENAQRQATENEREAGLANRPFNRSKTARLDEVNSAISNLRQYADNASDVGDPAQTRLLLWSLAKVERALHLQTRGHYGQRHAHALHVQRGLSNR